MLYEYLKRIKNNRKLFILFVFYKIFNFVLICMLVRWLKNVLELLGIRNFIVYFFCGIFVLVVYLLGVLIKEIMDVVNWFLLKIFFKFYYKEVNIVGCDIDGYFVNIVLNR